MYIYKLETTIYNLDQFGNKYDRSVRNDRYFSSMKKAKELVDLRVERYVTRRNNVLADVVTTDKSVKTYLSTKEDHFKEEGYHVITVFEIKKLEVE